MIMSADTCNRAATVVVVAALLWAVGTLWVIGALRGDIDDIDHDEGGAA